MVDTAVTIVLSTTGLRVEALPDQLEAWPFAATNRALAPIDATITIRAIP
jgi:hypothetical protein